MRTFGLVALLAVLACEPQGPQPAAIEMDLNELLETDTARIATVSAFDHHLDLLEAQLEQLRQQGVDAAPSRPPEVLLNVLHDLRADLARYTNVTRADPQADQSDDTRFVALRNRLLELKEDAVQLARSATVPPRPSPKTGESRR